MLSKIKFSALRPFPGKAQGTQSGEFNQIMKFSTPDSH